MLCHDRELAGKQKNWTTELSPENSKKKCKKTRGSLYNSITVNLSAHNNNDFQRFSNVTCVYSDNNVLSYKWQFGFTRHKSVLIQLVISLDQWTKAVDHKEHAKIVYTVFRKTFNKNLHCQINRTSESFDISYSLLGCLVDFLDQKTQEVWLSGTLS